VIWKAKLNNNETVAGQIDQASITKLKDRLQKNHIISISLVSDQTSDTITIESPKGIFLAKKGFFDMSGPQAHFYGIGSEDHLGVNIQWFNELLQQVNTEYRTIAECGFCYIKNPKDH